MGEIRRAELSANVRHFQRMNCLTFPCTTIRISSVALWKYLRVLTKKGASSVAFRFFKLSQMSSMQGFYLGIQLGKGIQIKPGLFSFYSV